MYICVCIISGHVQGAGSPRPVLLITGYLLVTLNAFVTVWPSLSAVAILREFLPPQWTWAAVISISTLQDSNDYKDF